MNAVMDVEADQLCGGGANSRNGYRERSLATCVGTLTWCILKLRFGSFLPEDVPERHRHEHPQGAEGAVSQVLRGRDVATVTAMFHAACDMLGRVASDRALHHLSRHYHD